jgi:hypothetical protein
MLPNFHLTSRNVEALEYSFLRENWNWKPNLRFPNTGFVILSLAGAIRTRNPVFLLYTDFQCC